jgi:hypothetical protein
MRTGAIVGAALVALLLASCGGGGTKSNGEADKTPEQVVQDARDAAVAASSAHLAGRIVNAGTPLTINLTLVKAKGAKGSISQSGLAFQVVRVGNTVYIKGSDAFLRRFAGAAAALLRGRWLKAQATGQFAPVASLTDLGKLLQAAIASHGKLKNDGETEFEGQKAVAIKDTTKGGTLYVAATGTPYPLALVGGTDAGKIVFDRWGASATIAAPQGAVDLSKLGG